MPNKTSSVSSGNYVANTTITGLGSGIEYDKMIESIMKKKNKAVEKIEKQQEELQEKIDAYKDFREKLDAVQTAAKTLNMKAAFNEYTTTSSNEDIATISATSSAVSQKVLLTVSSYAKADKIRSQAYTSYTATLSSGTIVINGKGIVSSGSDTLSEFIGKINDANCGADANLLDDGAGNYYIVIANEKTGALNTTKGTNNTVQICDVDGGTLLSGAGGSDFNMLNGTLALRTNVTDTIASDTACSFRFSDKDTLSIGTQMGLTGLASGNVTIGGVAVNIDRDNDTLQTIANSINAAGGTCTASINELEENGSTTYALYITKGGGAIGTGDFTDNSNILESLGVLQSGYNAGCNIVAGQNASVTLDGVSVSSQSNHMDSISGTTISLHGLSTLTYAELNVNRDYDAIVDKMKSVVESYNDLVEYVAEETQWYDDTQEGGVLMGDTLASNLPSELNLKLFTSPTGLSGTSLTNLTHIGISQQLSDADGNVTKNGVRISGKIQLDESTFKNYLMTNLNDTQNILLPSGKGSTNTIQFISSTNNTVQNSAYAVNITTIATQATTTAGTAQTLNNATAEQLTFTFHGKSYIVALTGGNSITDNINAINQHDTVGRYVTAENSGGNIKITSKYYGQYGDFTVVSDIAAAADSSGIGTTPVDASGTDVAGTINGETCTGDGQYLRGNSASGTFGSSGYTAGNTTTDGLKIRYTGNATGAVGSVSVSNGAIQQMVSYLDTVLQSKYTSQNGNPGILTAMEESLKEQYNELESNRVDLKLRLHEEEQQLMRKFQVMDGSIAKYSAQASRLGAIMSSLNGPGSGGGGGSKK